MFFDVPQNMILYVAGAFVLGYVIAMISSMLGAKYRAKKRDPRDDQIRELEAGLRIAKSNSDKLQHDLEQKQEELKLIEEGVERRDNVISEQQAKLERTTTDLKESVVKTRELRAELAERATENVKSEVKLREVETELSVARASSDMIATGVLEYGLAPGNEDETDGEPDSDKGVGNTAG